jgi:hypothetical protein
MNLLKMQLRQRQTAEEVAAIKDKIGADPTERALLLDDIMNSLPGDWQLRWCSSNLCACMGGSNCSGGLWKYGYTREEWQKWLEDRGLVKPLRIIEEKTNAILKSNT